MRLILRGVAMAGILAAAGSTGMGVSPVRACDHAPARGFDPVPPWGSGGGAYPPLGLAGLPDYEHCPVCRPRSFVPPPCPPPPCRDEPYAVGGYRYVSYREYRQPVFPATYPAPPLFEPATPVVTSFETPYYPSPPTKQAPGVYASPQYPVPSSGPATPYGPPRAQAPYPSQVPPGGYDQAPPLPSPDGVPQP